MVRRPPRSTHTHTLSLHDALPIYRVEQQVVAGREDVEDLPGGEFHHGLVMRRDAAHAGGGIVPPLLGQQERLVDQVEGRALPGRVAEPPVLFQRRDAGTVMAALRRAMRGIERSEEHTSELQSLMRSS